ncbi:glycosyltransferase [Tepidiphilus olei]|uniref:glycosyltransferase n=1 Tax=Tepidiphilus olei TaxID=2502184 RepID=UPI001C8F4DA1|nr:glycosyltransferase [Tepidiphilus olei]
MSVRVLQVYRTYYPDTRGGIEEVMRQIALAVRPQGVETTLFTLSPRPRPAVLERPEGRVVRARSWAAPASCDLGGVAALRQFARLAAQADLIHLHFPWPFADVLLAAVRPRAPVVVTYHSDVVRQQLLARFYAPLMWRTFARARAVVATSPPYAATSAVLQDERVRDKVRVIPLGMDEASLAQGDEGILDRLGLRPEEPFALFVGGLRYYKGLETLLEAARGLPGRVVIAGEGPEGATLRARAEALGLENVVFAGRVSDAEKAALLRACRLVVLPSPLRSEAFGMVLVEGAMCGKPLVSCEIGTGTTFVNVAGETGLVAPPGNAAALHAALARLLRDEGLAQRLGQGARRRYEEIFSGEALGAAYAALYAEVVRPRQDVGREGRP